MLQRIVELEVTQREILSEIHNVKSFLTTPTPNASKYPSGVHHSAISEISLEPPASEPPHTRSASSVTIVSGPSMKQLGKLPPELESMDLSESERKRQSSIYELIETEDDYIKDMQLLVNFHMANFKTDKLIPDEDIVKLFGNIEEIISANQVSHEASDKSD